MQKAFFEEPKFDLTVFSVVDTVDTNVVCSGFGNQEVGDDDDESERDR